MMRKVIYAIILLSLIGAGVGGMSLYSKSPASSVAGQSPVIVVGIILGGLSVLGLNLLGVAFKPKYFGSLGILVSLVFLAYGISVLVTKNLLFVNDPSMAPTVGGVATGVGALTLLTSTGIVVM